MTGFPQESDNVIKGKGNPAQKDAIAHALVSLVHVVRVLMLALTEGRNIETEGRLIDADLPAEISRRSVTIAIGLKPPKPHYDPLVID